jgi:malate dehydrogenase (oxaloacetate-decarboxylating)(NADP+)
VILALANPNPEIAPEERKAVRDDAIMATGRTDYPNQVNNVLCFPYIFRGALDCGATTITDEMEIAAVHAIAELAQAEQSEVVAARLRRPEAGLRPRIPDSQAVRPAPDDEDRPGRGPGRGRQRRGHAAHQGHGRLPRALQSFVYASGTTMKPIFTAAKAALSKRVAYAEGEEERVLRAAQIVVDEGLARPTLIGRPAIIAQRIEKFGLRLKEGVDYDVVNVEQDHRYRDFWQTYHRMTERKGVTGPDGQDRDAPAPDADRRHAAAQGRRGRHDLRHLGHHGHAPALHRPGDWQARGGSPSTRVRTYACMNGLMLPGRQVFLVDTHVNYDPTPEQLTEITVMAAEEMMRFGLKPKAALLSHSNFGSSNQPSAIKMRQTLELLREQAPWLEVDGEMHGDVAWTARRARLSCPHSTLKGDANLLVLPNIDAANISYNLLKTAAGGNIAIGPVLLGAAKPVHVLTASTTVRRIVNMTALTVADANAIHGKAKSLKLAHTYFWSVPWSCRCCLNLGSRLRFRGLASH